MRTYEYIILLLFVLICNLQAQSWQKIAGTNDYYPFSGITNDYIFIEGKPFMMGMSPLSYFKDYESIYEMNEEIKFSIQYEIPISADKDYNIYWTIGPDNIIYLCQTDVWTKEEFSQKVQMNFNKYIDLQTSINMPADILLLYHLNPAKYMRHIPIEQLTGQKFRQSPYFPMILDIPLNENGVLPAVWYSDTLYVKKVENAFEDRNGPYQQLIVKNGRVTKVNEIIPIIPPMPPRRKQ